MSPDPFDFSLCRDGWMEIRSIEFRYRTVPVYNLEVHGEHVYEVTASGILVHNAGTCTGKIPDGVDPAATRPKLRKATKEQAQAAAPKTPKGDYIDPNEQIVVPKEGPFDYGHPKGQEWWRTRDQARAEGWTRKQVIEAENAKKFQIEDPSSNRGHQHEQPQ